MTEDVNVQYLDQKPYAAKYDRQPFRDILTEGIITSGALEVTELDTPGMGVKSAKGRALVQGDQSEWQGHYGIRNDASKNLTIAVSDPINPRKDRIVAQVYDSVDIGGALDKWALEVLTGTPAASPVVPDLPDDALDLAIVDVAASATTITNADITDQRVQIDTQNLVKLVKTDTEQTITGAKTFKKTIQTIVTASDGATVTFNLSLGNIQQVTLGGNRILALSNVSIGQCFILNLIQNGAGSKTVTWFDTIKWADGSEPTLTTTANKTDSFGFICISAGNYLGFIVGQNL